MRSTRRLLPLIAAAAVLPATFLAPPPPAGAAAAPARGASTASTRTASASACSPRSDLLDRAPVARRRPARGVVVTGWNGTDGRGHLVRLTAARADVARVRLAAMAAGYGAATPTTALTRTVRPAVVGINGDYFAYDWSGAAVPNGPLVVGGRVLRLPAGAHPAVGADRSGRPLTGLVRVDGAVRLPVVAGASGARVLPVASVNEDGDPAGPDSVSAGRAVAVVTPYLGRARPSHAREIVVRRGVVVASGRRLSFGAGGAFGAGRRGRDDVLVAADGVAARTLQGVGRGTSVHVRYVARTVDGSRLSEALGSGAVLLRAGRVVVPCGASAAQSRPRTLVAWDASRRRVWLLTVDGRGSQAPVSRYGATYRQIAEAARALGARNAVMLDGGGSTTMAMRGSNGSVRRVDAPPSAPQRPVPDGLVLIPR